MQTYSLNDPSGPQYELDWYDDSNPPSSDQLSQLMGSYTSQDPNDTQQSKAPDDDDEDEDDGDDSSPVVNGNGNNQPSGILPTDPTQTATSSNATSLATANGNGQSQSSLFTDAHAKSAPPANVMPADNPNGRGVIIYVNGSFSDHTAWTPDFVNAVNKTYTPMHQEAMDWDQSGVGQSQSGMAMSDIKALAVEKLTQKIYDMRRQFPGQPIMVIGHSNGGNIAVQAATQFDDATERPDYIVRLGSPILNDTTGEQTQGSPTHIIDAYNTGDKVRSQYSVVAGGGNPTPPNYPNWHGTEVETPKNGSAGVNEHTSMISPWVWTQLQMPMLEYGFMKGFGGRAYVPPTRIR